MADVAAQLDLGEFNHITFAVRDMEKGIARLKSLGMTTGPVLDLLVPSVYRGQDTEAGVKAVFAPLGSVALELVEPTGGKSPIATFLENHGEGVQHFGYRVEDLPGTIARVEAMGIEVEWLVSDEHGPAVAFLAPDAFFGVSIELARKEPPLDVGAMTRG